MGLGLSRRMRWRRNSGTLKLVLRSGLQSELFLMSTISSLVVKMMYSFKLDYLDSSLRDFNYVIAKRIYSLQYIRKKKCEKCAIEIQSQLMHKLI